MKAIRRDAADATKTSVRKLMVRPAVCAHPGQLLVDAGALMRAKRVSALAVLDDETIVGIITELDFLRTIADRRDPAASHVSQYMTKAPLAIEADAPADKAAAVMVKHRLRHLPVTDGGRLIGFLSACDLLALKPWPRSIPFGDN